eukprot:2258594-Pleurochrysis_carterae.AAC.1
MALAFALLASELCIHDGLSNTYISALSLAALTFALGAPLYWLLLKDYCRTARVCAVLSVLPVMAVVGLAFA